MQGRKGAGRSPARSSGVCDMLRLDQREAAGRDAGATKPDAIRMSAGCGIILDNEAS